MTHGRRSCWCEVAVGESAAQRSPWELEPVMWRSRFTFACITSSTSDTVFFPHFRRRITPFFFVVISDSLLKASKQPAEDTVCFLKIPFSRWIYYAKSLYCKRMNYKITVTSPVLHTALPKIYCFIATVLALLTFL